MKITKTGAIQATSEENRIEIIHAAMGMKAPEIPMEYRIGTANKDNFFFSSYANFSKCEMPTVAADYESNSGSKYFYSELGVIRVSNHFGDVASCNWLLNGGSYEGTEVAGFCKWTDFIHIMQQATSEFGDDYFSTFECLADKESIRISENEKAYF